jgi:hypothetical protein
LVCDPLRCRKRDQFGGLTDAGDGERVAAGRRGPPVDGKAALGVRTHAGAIRQAGAKSVLLDGIPFAFLMVGGYAINRVVGILAGV